MHRKLLSTKFLRASLFTFLLASSASDLQAQQTGLNFDGGGDYIQTNYSGVTGSGARTVEAWIRTTKDSNPGAAGQSVIVDWGSLTNGMRFTFNILWNNALRIEIAGGGLNGVTPVNDGEWHHVAVVYNPTATTKFSLYVDGVLDASGNVTSASVNSGTTTKVRVGSRIDGVGFFQGDIDDVRVWNVARTQQEIQDNMDVEFCAAQTNLTLYLKLNEGVAGGTNTGVTTVNSTSTGVYTGTLTSFALTGATSNFVAGPIDLVGVNSSVTLAEATLTAGQAGATYQWIDCDDENAPIEGATSQSFTATVSGNYAVIVTLGGCSVTSSCMAVVIGGAEVCEAPTAIEIASITETGAVVTWTENGDATAWEVIYGPAGFDPETAGTTVEVATTAETTLSELTEDTAYDVYVRAICSDELMSEWEGPEAFTTQIMGISKNTIAGFEMYPNPTTGVLTLKGENIVDIIEVYNLTGQRVMNVMINAVSSEINVAHLQQGVYVMKVNSNGQTGIYKIVKR